MAGLLMALGGGTVLADFGYLIMPDGVLSLGLLAVPITVFSTVGVINVVNMIDGLDGLAASLVLIASIALGIIIAWSGGNAWGIALLDCSARQSSLFLGSIGASAGRRWYSWAIRAACFSGLLWYGSSSISRRGSSGPWRWSRYSGCLRYR